MLKSPVSAPHDGISPLPTGVARVSDETMEEVGFPRELTCLHEKIATDCDRKRPDRTEKRSVYAPLRIIPNSDARSLYFIRNPYLDLIKIGIADDVTQRLWSLECACGVPLDLLRVVKAGAPYEPHLHDAFRETRLFGEWFRPTPELLRLIERPVEILEFLAYAEDRRRSA
jgi:hypothetical protein